MFRNTLLTTLILLIAHRVLAAEGESKPAADKRPTKIWSRTGPLGETPKHVTDAYPLSDQENKSGWVEFEPMTDEFGPAVWGVVHFLRQVGRCGMICGSSARL